MFSKQIFKNTVSSLVKWILYIACFLCMGITALAQFTVNWMDSYPNAGVAGVNLDVDEGRNVLVVGVKNTTPQEYVVIKYDQEGSMLWDKSFTAPDSYIRQIKVACGPDGSVYVAGRSEAGSLMTTHFFARKLDALGTVVWSSPAIAVDSILDTPEFRQLLVDDLGNAYISGRVGKPQNVFGDTIYERVLIARLESSNGVIAWLNQYDGPVGWSAASAGMMFDNQGNLLNVGAAITASEYCEEIIYGSLSNCFSI